jgi:putative transcriptional regulator
MHTSLKGKLLISMSTIMDTMFHESVVLLCEHSADGAMGLIINKPMMGVNFMELADRLDLTGMQDDTRDRLENTPVLTGGPVDQHRGFVLHGPDYPLSDLSLRISEAFSLTATLDVLQDMAAGKGPSQRVMFLGYAGWSPGQLENEILRNSWLHCDADAELVFAPDWPQKHRKALAKLGVDPRLLSSEAGHG